MSFKISWSDLSRRAETAELMDGGQVSAEAVRAALGFLRMTNRWFGGAAVILTHLERFRRRWPKGFSPRVLDVGTGDADIPLAMVRWARARGVALRVTALDHSPAIVQRARANTRGVSEINVLEGDFFGLAETGGPYDYVTASLFLHHTPVPELHNVLRAFDRLAGRGVIVSDLVRSAPAYAGVWLLSRLAGSEVVRFDGPLSVRRAFRPHELQATARQAGLNYLRVATHPPWFRLSLAGEKGDGPRL